MFGFTWTARGRSRAAAVRCALERDGLPPSVDTALGLGVVESRGTYAGRKVTYIRVFDPARASERGLQVHRFDDLDAHRNLVLRTGHVEQDGTVVISWRAPSADAATPARGRADRAMHANDDRIVFPSPAASKLVDPGP